jgi:hypothetical protein
MCEPGLKVSSGKALSVRVFGGLKPTLLKHLHTSRMRLQRTCSAFDCKHAERQAATLCLPAERFLEERNGQLALSL